MRVIHIIPNLRKGGAERLALDICASLSARPGMQVRLINLHHLMQFDVAESGVDVKVIPASIHVSPIRPNKLNVAALQQEVESFQPDIIHSHLFESEIVSRSIDYPGAKWFSHCHDNMHQLETFYLPTLFNKKLFTEFYERLYLFKRYRVNGGNRFIAISRHTEKYFERVLPDDLRNVMLLHNGVNTALFKKPSNFVLKSKADLELVTVGSLIPLKNHTFLLDVVKKLKQRKYNVHLNILGEGITRASLERKIKDLGIGDCVTLHGSVANVQQILWNCDICVHASHSEAFGLVLVEAMAAGLPVISLDGRGNRDIIKNHKNGFILEKQSVTDFADKIGLLFHDKFKYNQMQAAGFETAAKLDIVPYTDKLIELYEAALNS